jgi:hypothetical protein
LVSPLVTMAVMEVCFSMVKYEMMVVEGDFEVVQ